MGPSLRRVSLSLVSLYVAIFFNGDKNEADCGWFGWNRSSNCNGTFADIAQRLYSLEKKEENFQWVLSFFVRDENFGCFFFHFD